jgi:hypothetical protein
VVAIPLVCHVEPRCQPDLLRCRAGQVHQRPQPVLDGSASATVCGHLCT